MIDATVLAIKLRDGTNILTLYAGETDDGTGIRLYRPVRIVNDSTLGRGGSTANYVPELYFPYGQAAMDVAKIDIMHQVIASEFFARLYLNYLGDLLRFENSRQEALNKHMDKLDLKTIMDKTTSVYCEQETAYKH